VVQNELARRKHAIGYGRTAHGFEIDFQARNAEGALQLIQVCADVSEPATLSRELRALDDAAQTYPDASRHLLVLERPPQPLVQAQGVQVQPVYEWLLATDAAV